MAWTRWPVQVALAVHDCLRLAGGAARERDQARVVRAQVGDRRGLGAVQLLIRDVQDTRRERPVAGCRELLAVALVGDDQRRARDLDPHAQVLRSQLLGARKHDRPDPEAREHRHDPLRPVADQGHDDVAAAHAELGQAAREPRGAGPELTEGPLTPVPVAGELDESPLPIRHAGEDVGGEVHTHPG